MLDFDWLPLVEGEFPNIDWKLITNELMKLIVFEKLDDNNLQILKDKIDNTKVSTLLSMEFVKKIFLQFEFKDLIKKPIMTSDVLDCVILQQQQRCLNAFIISNRKSSSLKKVQNSIKNKHQKIWESEKEIINNLLQKLVSNDYVLNMTGPNIFLLDMSCMILPDLCSLKTFNAGSTWLNTESEDSDCDFEDLEKKYTLQLVVSGKIKLNIEELKKYQKSNETELENLTCNLDWLLKETNELKKRLAIENLKPESERGMIIFSQKDINHNVKIIEKDTKKIELLSYIQKILSEKILLQDFDSFVSDINEIPANQEEKQNQAQVSKMFINS